MDNNSGEMGHRSEKEKPKRDRWRCRAAVNLVQRNEIGTTVMIRGGKETGGAGKPMADLAWCGESNKSGATR